MEWEDLRLYGAYWWPLDDKSSPVESGDRVVSDQSKWARQEVSLCSLLVEEPDPEEQCHLPKQAAVVGGKTIIARAAAACWTRA